MSQETNDCETEIMAEKSDGVSMPFASREEWKRYLLSAVLPMVVVGAWWCISDSGVALWLFIILAIRSVAGLSFMLSHCRARCEYLSRHPNESDYGEVNKNTILEVLKNRKPMTDGDSSASVPAALESLWLTWKGRWIRYVFSLSPYFVNENIRTYLKEKFPERAPVRQGDRQKEAKPSPLPAAESEYASIVDYLSLKKFMLSDILPGLWLLLSIGDVYILVKLYGDVLSPEWLVGIIIASLVVIRIVSEYTAVLFSIATLAREIRNELKVSNEMRRKELADADRTVGAEN